VLVHGAIADAQQFHGLDVNLTASDRDGIDPGVIRKI
jgi:hypothetical protein